MNHCYQAWAPYDKSCKMYSYSHTVASDAYSDFHVMLSAGVQIDTGYVITYTDIEQVKLLQITL